MKGVGTTMDRVKESQRLRIDEGDRLVPYLDSKGIKTIATGWNMEANPLPDDIQAYLDANGRITQEMDDRLLDIQIESKLKDCRILWPAFDSFSEGRQEGLCDIMYNMGLHTLQGFHHMNAAINADPPDWTEAATQLKYSDASKTHFSKWYSDVHAGRGEEVCNLLLNG